MKGRLIPIMMSAVLMITMTSTMAYAGSQEKKESTKINTVEQLKMALAEPNSEIDRIVKNTNNDVIVDFMEDKIDDAIKVINDMQADEKMKGLSEGRETFTNEYDLGDGCTLRIELSDKQEGENVPMATRNSGDLWKAYGNRSFTASASVQCKVGTANMQLENHYTLSENGIDENYGIASVGSGTESVKIEKSKPIITDYSARTAGGSDVNMYCVFTIKENISGQIQKNILYKLNTRIGYVEADKAGKRLKVRQSWNLVKE